MSTDCRRSIVQKMSRLATIGALLLAFGLIQSGCDSSSSSSSLSSTPTPTPLSCSISPVAGATDEGVPITFTGSTVGGEGVKSFEWDCSEGSGAPGTSTEAAVEVTYGAQGGPFNVLLAVSDENGATASCSTMVTINGSAPNFPPVARDDNYETIYNTSLQLPLPGVLGNDSDAENDPLVAVLDVDVSSGTLTLNGDGSLNYSPNIDFVGEVTFSYYADDGEALSNTSALVTITVNPLPPPPTGEELVNAKCIMCHGALGAGGYADTVVRNVTLSLINNAILEKPEMAFLGYLTDAERTRIESYLNSVPQSDAFPRDGDIVVGEATFRQSCTYCHTFGGTPIEPPRPGPDLMGISAKYSRTWVGAWIDYPTEMIAAGGYDSALLADFPYVMQDLGHPPVDVWNVVEFLFAQDAVGPLPGSGPVALTTEEFDASTQVYFNLCAGCHGLYRTGATGPDIGSARSMAIGTDGLGAILRYGTPAGMGNFGQTGILTEEEITDLSAYLQLAPPDAPPLPMTDIQASWDLIIPVAARPAAPEHTRNWENYVGVILRDAGQVAIFDGDTNEEIVRLTTGFAVHILRSSSTGRYFYAIGRDGLVTMIDLWTTVPTVVASVKGCHDARSVESSKYVGFEDVYVIEGCYWPPQYVVFDGLTLEPLELVDLPMDDIDGVTLPEVRVASIVASHNDPVWVVALKESGYVAIVDYSDEVGSGFPLVTTIATEKFLHDGGFDHTGRYFLVAANANNKIVVVDLETQSLVSTILTGAVPHPGRGVNWIDPVYGWVNATSHIGEGKVTVYGADPAGRPDVAWQIVREIPLPSAGSLFVKSHPNSPWVLADMTLSATGYEQDICAISKASGTLYDCFPVATNGRAVHIEFNMDGSEIWVSDWDPDGAVVVLDSTTLTEIRRFSGLQTPTGKFNVFNTAHDIY